MLHRVVALFVPCCEMIWKSLFPLHFENLLYLILFNYAVNAVNAVNALYYVNNKTILFQIMSATS